MMIYATAMPVNRHDDRYGKLQFNREFEGIGPDREPRAVRIGNRCPGNKVADG
jgi:hypothetical protein